MLEEHGTAFNPHPAQGDSDLSQEIAGLVERLPGDLVRCTRVGVGKYRCNWWCLADTRSYDNPLMKGGQVGTTHRIRKSQYLLATRRGDRIIMEPAPRL